MRAISKNTRKATAITLAAALVIAVYLNWQYARTDTGIAADEEAQVVSAEPVFPPQRAKRTSWFFAGCPWLHHVPFPA